MPDFDEIMKMAQQAQARRDGGIVSAPDADRQETQDPQELLDDVLDGAGRHGRPRARSRQAIPGADLVHQRPHAVGALGDVLEGRHGDVVAQIACGHGVE